MCFCLLFLFVISSNLLMFYYFFPSTAKTPIWRLLSYLLGFPGCSDSKLPAMWEIWVRPMDQEDPLEKEMTTHSSILAWKIPWTEEPGRLQSIDRVTTSWTGLSYFTFTFTLTSGTIPRNYLRGCLPRQ